MASFYKPGSISIGRMIVTREEAGRYGNFDFGTGIPDHDQPSWRAVSLVEKPKGEPPSLVAIAGRFILPPEIMDELAQATSIDDREINLTDEMAALMARGTPAYATHYEGTRHDCGTIGGYMRASLAVAERYLSRRDPLFNAAPAPRGRHLPYPAC